MSGGGVKTVTETTLTGTSDTFTYNPTRNPILYIRNPTGGSLTPTIDGSGATTVPVGGVGSVDISAGKSLGAIGAGAARVIELASISRYLDGTIAITSGTGLVCSLLEF